MRGDVTFGRDIGILYKAMMASTISCNTYVFSSSLVHVCSCVEVPAVLVRVQINAISQYSCIS